MAQQARCLEAAHHDAAFDWDVWNARFDAGQVMLKASLDRWADAERQTIDRMRNVRLSIVHAVGGLTDD